MDIVGTFHLINKSNFSNFFFFGLRPSPISCTTSNVRTVLTQVFFVTEVLQSKGNHVC